MGGHSAGSEHPCILVVDDNPDSLELIAALLRPHYRVQATTNGRDALRLARAEPQPDLILLDVMMPEPGGFTICRQLKADLWTRDIPIIFLTALDSANDEQAGIELGAVDYLTKPASPAVALARIRAQLQLKASADFLRDHNAFLEQEVERRTHEVLAVQDVTIRTLAALAETRDNETGNHIRRTQHYVRCLAERLREQPRFAPQLDAHTIELLFKSAPLHDIGKVGIPDRILLKPGKLTADEFEVMKTHTTLGRDAIRQAQLELGAHADFLHFAAEIAQSHQEKWDGSGYPEGLAGDAIPLSARLMAVADVYDALISRRVYKPAFPHRQAVAIMREGRGSHFDPDVLDAFLELQDDFDGIACRFADADDDRALALPDADVREDAPA
ncbi:MAG TPA: two-component system response regulator [Arenimonas sp.]|nr:two-component system response regulator [Arenimonas sp.]